jgi:hypothetical protein
MRLVHVNGTAPDNTTDPAGEFTVPRIREGGASAKGFSIRIRNTGAVPLLLSFDGTSFYEIPVPSALHPGEIREEGIFHKFYAHGDGGTCTFETLIQAG